MKIESIKDAYFWAMEAYVVVRTKEKFDEYHRAYSAGKYRGIENCLSLLMNSKTFDLFRTETAFKIAKKHNLAFSLVYNMIY